MLVKKLGNGMTLEPFEKTLELDRNWQNGDNSKIGEMELNLLQILLRVSELIAIQKMEWLTCIHAL